MYKDAQKTNYKTDPQGGSDDNDCKFNTLLGKTIKMALTRTTASLILD